jgi:hypothetical protein
LAGIISSSARVRHLTTKVSRDSFGTGLMTFAILARENAGSLCV